jgi:uncharacterized damage-inducible protein DinB
MDEQSLKRRWDLIRQQYGIYLRLIESIPEDKLRAHVVPSMRTPAELIAHTSGTIVRDFARGVADGEIRTTEKEDAVASELSSREEASAYARRCWEDADSAMQEVGDEELRATVKTPWNMSFPGTAVVNMLSDEFLHHRGQLYVYARAAGGEPPFLWSFDKNEPAFAPRR